MKAVARNLLAMSIIKDMSSIIVDKIHSTVKIDNPTHVIELPKQVMRVEMSPYEWSHNIMCIAYKDEIAVATIKFQEEDESMEEGYQFEVLCVFDVTKRVHALALSPETSLHVLPKCVSFCYGAADFNIHLHTTNLSGSEDKRVLRGHRSYINDVAYEGSGDTLASVSDDVTCRLWSVKESFDCYAVFSLLSPGMSVCWHNDDAGKLLVAEKNGTIRVYSVERQQAILSFDASCVPLMVADWSPVNYSRVAALAGGNLIVWDTTRPSRPIEFRPLHPDGGRFLRYSHHREFLIATVGQPDNTLKVIHTNIKQPVIMSSLVLATSVSWVYRLPYVCVAVDRSICFWKVPTK